ncbi:hypothetical protein CBR_g19884 [Chara braunii]|uniref:Mitochondrial import inner membrane translocase subunit TIM23 n=1 Tax=Chara braunii TaxID=69332 RepID=A0A388KYX2_CHABU|nr:hypothetical protein CBR_g19884 [Chara braunii]|eukprot:GBG75249.1 hypothetical protein CBR_g19884 [Chara braunii]
MLRDEGDRSRDVSPLGPDEGVRLYNPYADLHGALDRKDINLYKLPPAPEFLFSEEANIQRRSWNDYLVFYTGVAYVTGALAGGSQRFVEGLRLKEAGDMLKLRVNRLLNATGHRGRNAGNTLGILGLLYMGMEGAMFSYWGSDDVFNGILAGLGTGALYKAAAGPRTTAIAGAVGGLAAAGFAAGKQLSKRYIG